MTKHKSIVFEGNVYKNKTELASSHNVTLQTFNYRIKQGATIEEALSTDRKKHLSNGLTIEFEGVVYQSIPELCEAYNVKVTTFHDRKKRGKSLKECVYGARGLKDKINYNGKGYSSYIELCKDNNVSYSTFHNRMRDGYSIEEIIEGKKGTRFNLYHVEFDNVIYRSEKDMCEKLNVKYNTFRKRKAKGLPMNECIYGKLS